LSLLSGSQDKPGPWDVPIFVLGQLFANPFRSIHQEGYSMPRLLSITSRLARRRSPQAVQAGKPANTTLVLASTAAADTSR
jgi:hypothetical protein